MIIACVWVEANVPFSSEYVIRLKSMVERHAAGPLRFICFTDRPNNLFGIECIKIDKPVARPGWWSKLELFNPEHEWALGNEMVTYIDLDVIVLSLDFVWRPGFSDLTLIPHEGSFEGRHGLRVIKRYNSSVMRWQAGTYSDLWTKWSPAIARRLWGDQDWIGEQLDHQPTFPLQWFPRISSIEGNRAKLDGAKIVLCKRPKNEQAARQWEWVREKWR